MRIEIISATDVKLKPMPEWKKRSKAWSAKYGHVPCLAKYSHFFHMLLRRPDEDTDHDMDVTLELSEDFQHGNGFDHVRFWKGCQDIYPRYATAEPYDLDDHKLEKMIAVARKHGLSLEIPSMEGIWNPGSATLVVVYPKNDYWRKVK